jgi:DNA-binding transcriptional LysR family regulator
MNIKQLEVFVAIVETGSFSKAAERTSLTQSTASQHIAALESSCGVRLLDRTGRGALPTEAGKVLLANALRVLGALQVTEQSLRQFCRAENITLGLAASTIPGTYLVPAAVALMRQECPTLSVTVTMGDSAAVLEQLTEGMVEVAVLGSPVTDKRVIGEAIGHDRIILVAPARHHWQQINPVELLGEPMIMREAGSGTGSVVNGALQQAGIDSADLNAGVVLGSSEAVKQAVLAGCGVAFISEVAVRGELKAGILREIRVLGLDIQRTFTLAWRQGRTPSPAAEVFCNAIRRVASGNCQSDAF